MLTPPTGAARRGSAAAPRPGCGAWRSRRRTRAARDGPGARRRPRSGSRRPGRRRPGLEPRTQALDALVGLGAVADEVAETHHHVGRLAVDLLEHRVEGFEVAVDVGEDRDPHRGSATAPGSAGRAPPGPARRSRT